jgi:hypothetical protein
MEYLFDQVSLEASAADFVFEPHSSPAQPNIILALREEHPPGSIHRVAVEQMYKKYKDKLDECLNRYHEIEVRTRPPLWMTDDLTLP